MKKRYLLIAGGKDRKGIVYNLTKILKKYDFNIEDSSMQMLRKTFSIIMILSLGKELNKRFNDEIKNFSNKYKMIVDIKKIDEKYAKEYKKEGKIFIINISGADKPGIVNKITEYLYKKNINIINLETKSSEKIKPHAYYMILEVDIPKNVNSKIVEKQLKNIAQKINVHLTIDEIEDVLL